jgi:hypothetical protein
MSLTDDPEKMMAALEEDTSAPETKRERIAKFKALQRRR